MTTERTPTATAKIPAPATAYQGDIARYWDKEARPVNLRLGDVDGLYHHHYGIGDVDHAALGDPTHSEYEKKLDRGAAPTGVGAGRILLDHLGPIGPDDTLVDAGCGRGGSIVMAHQRFGCRAEGVTLSAKQADFANRRARELRYRRNASAPACATCSTRPSTRGGRGLLEQRVDACTSTCTTCSPSTPAS